MFPYAGGPGIGRFTRPYDLALEWRRHGVETTVFSSAHHHLLYDSRAQTEAVFSVDGVSYRIVPGTPYGGNGFGRLRHMLQFAWRLPEAMATAAREQGRPAAIIVSSPHPFAIVAAVRAARRCQARLIFEVRDIWPFTLRQTFGTSKFHPLYILLALIERYAYRRADAVVSLLPAARPHMVERGLDPAKFHVIPNGAPDELDEGDLPAAVGEWLGQCKAEGRRIVGYAGSFGRPYATGSFLGAYERLAGDPSTSGRLAFIFAGDGEERADLERGIAALRARRNRPPVLFAGQLTRGATGTMLRACDCGLVFTRNNPLFQHGIAMNKIAEYMRLGIPIIAAYTAGNDPVMEAGCGWRVPPESPGDFADALTAFAALSDMEAAALGERGRRYFLEHHEYRAIATKYLSILGLGSGQGLTR